MTSNVINKYLSSSHVTSVSIQVCPNLVDERQVDLMAKTPDAHSYKLIATLTEQNQDDLIAYLADHVEETEGMTTYYVGVTEQREYFFEFDADSWDEAARSARAAAENEDWRYLSDDTATITSVFEPIFDDGDDTP